MKPRSYRISEKAVEDLEDIWTYTFHKWSIKQADRYYNLIILVSNPVHPLAFATPLWLSPAGKYRLRNG